MVTPASQLANAILIEILKNRSKSIDTVLALKYTYLFINLKRDWDLIIHDHTARRA